MKKILLICTALLLTLGLVGAGTFAYFFDTETSIGNTFAAGTLDLTVYGANDPLPVKFTLGNLAPGGTGTITYVLKNVGTLDGFIDLQGVTVVNAPGVTTEPEGLPDAGELGANIWITVTVGGTPVYTGLLNGFVGDVGALSVPLAAGATASVVITWVVDKDGAALLGADVGNVIQGDSATVGIVFELAQTAGQ